MSLIRSRIFWLTIASYLLASFVFVSLRGGVVPSGVSGTTLVAQLSGFYGILFWQLLLIAIIFYLTRGRNETQQILPQADPRVLKKEIFELIAYGASVLAGGQLLGHILGMGGIGLHLPGTLYLTHSIPSVFQTFVWMIYNLVFFALIPYFWFRNKGYSKSDVLLRSRNFKNDLVVIFVILALESMAQFFALSNLQGLSGAQLFWGAIISFLVYLFGTGLPILIFVQALLVPRYFRVSNSFATAVVLGGVSYAALHMFEYWTLYDSWQHILVSLIVVGLQFIGPGMVKSTLTLRTGNAWTHLWAYHAIAPHVVVDLANIVRIFNL